GVALRHRRDHRRAEVLGMRAREPDPLDPVDRVAGAKELAELGSDVRDEVPSPRVDVLAEQRDLTDPVSGELRHLGPDLSGSPRHLAAANGRDDAVRALRVAAHRDLHPGLEPALAMHRKLARKRAVVEPKAATCDAESACAEPVAEVRDRAGPE